MQASPSSSGPRRVALASVDPLVRGVLARALESGGLAVVPLTDADALADVGALDVDAVVLDDGPDRGASVGDEDDADEVAQERPLAELGLPVVALAATPARARALLAAGAHAALLRDGDGDRLRAALGAVALGMLVIDVAFADAALPAGPGGDGADDPLPSWVEPLTAREMDVLALLAEGLSNKDIAEQLAISPHTAKFHVNAILAKMDAQTRTEAVVRAARLGILTL